MIISASYKTDIPAFYGSWFRERLAAGSARVANPWGGPPFTVSLAGEDVAGFLFWSRNVDPFFPTLEDLQADGWPFVVQMTVTGYPRPLERSVIPMDRAIDQIRGLSRRFGARSVVWRYDPVLLTDLTPPEAHRKTFVKIAGALAGYVDEVTLSFATPYRKTKNNLERLRRESGLAWFDPDEVEKRALLAELGELALEAGIKPTLCAQPELLVAPMEPAACIDATRLSDVAGTEIPAKTKGNRPGCLCAESRDIGAYDSCPHGCVYCYAVGRPETAKRRMQDHDPTGPALLPLKERVETGR